MELIVRDSTFFMRSVLIIVCCVQWSENLNSLVDSKVGETEHLAIVFLYFFLICQWCSCLGLSRSIGLD